MTDKITVKWTEERIETLLSMWKKGLASSQIGHAMGVSRNAVIGKIHRLEKMEGEAFSREGAEKKSTNRVNLYKPREQSPRPRLMAPSEPSPIPVFLEEEPDRNNLIRLYDLTATHCREVMARDHDGVALFCGLPKHIRMRGTLGELIMSSFCPYHHSINYQQQLGVRNEHRRRDDSALPRDQNAAAKSP